MAIHLLPTLCIQGVVKLIQMGRPMAAFCRASAIHNIMRDLAIGGVSACLTHADINSKRITVGLCGFHCRVAQRLLFLKPNFVP